MAKSATAEVDSLDEFLANISEDGTHVCIVDTVSSSQSKKDGRDWIIITYVVNDENSDIDGEDIQEFIENFTHVTLADYNSMSAGDKRKVREAKRRLRDRLLTLGVAENEVSGFKDFDLLMGREVNVTVETSIASSGKKYINIRNVELTDNDL